MYLVLQMATCAVQLWAVCAMTRMARGWIVTGAAFALYALVRFGYDWGCTLAGFSSEATLQLRFVVLWSLFTLLVVGLSRDNLGRRIFLALDYGAYSAAFLPLMQSLGLWKPAVFAGGGVLCSIIVMVAAHAVFILVLLPLVPHSNRRIPWRIASVASFGMFLLLYATGIWPNSLATGGWRAWTAFLLSSAVAWVIFPMMYAGIKAYFHGQSVEHDLSQMVAEVALRREAIDAARRQRHDLRHHRIVIADHLLHGHVDDALSYIERLDCEADRTPTSNFIWCDNDTINAILSGLSRLAKAKGVVFEVTANVEKVIGVPVIDLVALVANLVENAINAGARGNGGQGLAALPGGSGATGNGGQGLTALPGGSGARGNGGQGLAALPGGSGATGNGGQGLTALPGGSGVGRGGPPRRATVTVALRQRERTFGMTVTNPVPEGFELSREGLPCKEAGVGIESVGRVISRYGGELVYSVADGILTCQAMVRIL